mgnify:CR=1 FL=1
MKQRFLIVLSFLLITAILLTSCAANDGVPKEAKELFQKYMDGCASDMKEAAKIVLFRDDADRTLFEESSPVPGTYKMLKWQKINDSLWAVEWENPDEVDSSKQHTCWSFVILIDGQYYVARGLAEIPRAMRDTFDMEPYMPTGNEMLPPFSD